MIWSFADEGTKDLFQGTASRKARRFPANIHRTALRKLAMINAAALLSDLRVPPGNHLEALVGDLAGYHSIRINGQWRIVFRWESGAHEVRIVDYH